MGELSGTNCCWRDDRRGVGTFSGQVWGFSDERHQPNGDVAHEPGCPLITVSSPEGGTRTVHLVREELHAQLHAGPRTPSDAKIHPVSGSSRQRSFQDALSKLTRYPLDSSWRTARFLARSGWSRVT